MKPIVPTMLALLLVGSAGLSGLVPAYAQVPPAAHAPAPEASPDMQAPGSNGRSESTQPDEGQQASPQQGSQPGFNRDRRQQGNAMRNPSNRNGPDFDGGRGFGSRGFDGGLGTSVLRLACGDRGAEALEIAFVRIQYEIKPTGQQQPLFDALKTAALADQKNYADACQAAISSVRGQGNTQARADNLLDRFSARLALETARVNALNDVFPKFRAFFDSLTDAQKAAFQPRRMGFIRNGRPDAGPGAFGGWRDRQGGAGNGNRPGIPGGLQRLPAPGSQPNPSAPASDPSSDASETPA